LVVVYMSGSSLDLSYIRSGLALVNAILGDYNPSGHLSITFYPNIICE